MFHPVDLRAGCSGAVFDIKIFQYSLQFVPSDGDASPIVEVAAPQREDVCSKLAASAFTAGSHPPQIVPRCKTTFTLVSVTPDTGLLIIHTHTHTAHCGTPHPRTLNSVQRSCGLQLGT